MRSTDDPSSVGAADDSPLVFEGDSHSVEMDDPPSVGAEGVCTHVYSLQSCFLFCLFACVCFLDTMFD